MCEPWAAPVWNRLTFLRHRKANERMWRLSLARSNTIPKGAKSLYSPLVSEAVIRDLELGCALGLHGTLIHESGHVRTFYVDSSIANLGYSRGESTGLIFVMWHCTGEAHGYPITRGELDRKLQ